MALSANNCFFNRFSSSFKS